MGYSGGNSLGRELTDAEKLWKDNEIKRLDGLQQYRDHYSIGKKDVVVKDKVLGKTEYRGDQGDQDGTPGKPEQRQYNAGFYEAFSARLAAKQENKMAKQKEKRDNKSIRRYEEGSRGFLGIGKGKGKGELNERVVSGYESRGKRNDNFNYDADGNITGERGTLEGQIGKQGMSNEFSDQVVTKQMRDRANTLSMNKTGQALGDTIIIDGTPDKEGKKGKARVSFRYENNFSAPSQTPKFLGAVDYMRMYNQAQRMRDQSALLKYSIQQITGTEQGLNPELYPDVDWHNELFNDFYTVNG